MLSIIKNGTIIGILLLSSVRDMRCRKIRVYPVFAGILILFVCGVITEPIPIGDMLGGFAVGVVMYGIGRITGGKIGKGDSYIIGMIGIGMGMRATVQIVCVGLVVAAGSAIILLLLRLAGRKTRIPFVPFLLVGYLITVAM